MSLCISAHWRICSPNIEGRPDFLWTIVMMIGHCLKKSWRCLGKKSDCGKSLIRSLTYRELWTDASGSSWPELARLVSGPPGLSRILVGLPSFSMKLFSRWWLILPGPPRPPLPENKIFIFLFRESGDFKRVTICSCYLLPPLPPVPCPPAPIIVYILAPAQPPVTLKMPSSADILNCCRPWKP